MHPIEKTNGHPSKYGSLEFHRKHNHRIRNYPCYIKRWIDLPPNTVTECVELSQNQVEDVREHNHNAHGKEAAVHDSSGISTVENRRRGVSTAG